ncbi:hypothetical protein AAH450_16430 [Erwinia sp. P7711]|uniref:hypothetical protein n=1 Tax=Erwinia sp. P7711 TaxID=3141451 RepID=UPI003187800F
MQSKTAIGLYEPLTDFFARRRHQEISEKCAMKSKLIIKFEQIKITKVKGVSDTNGGLSRLSEKQAPVGKKLLWLKVALDKKQV